jgi:hypothetical protein
MVQHGGVAFAIFGWRDIFVGSSMLFPLNLPPHASAA